VFPHSRALDDEKELEEERRLAYVGMTRAMRRLFLSHAWRRATWGMGQPSVPSRFLLEIPAELMAGPDLASGSAGLDVDLDLAFGARGTTRFGRPIRNGLGGGAAYRQASGTPGAPQAGQPFRPTRDLNARREAYDEGARSGSLARPGGQGVGGGPSPVKPPRPIIPGERQYRDGDRVRHGRWGDGIVVTSKLTRSDEEITVAFKDPSIGRKTMLASLANLDLVG
jgi:DNA helicase-2/ATP-dependent DNA helicase PcrA